MTGFKEVGYQGTEAIKGNGAHDDGDIIEGDGEFFIADDENGHGVEVDALAQASEQGEGVAIGELHIKQEEVAGVVFELYGGVFAVIGVIDAHTERIQQIGEDGAFFIVAHDEDGDFILGGRCVLCHISARIRSSEAFIRRAEA